MIIKKISNSHHEKSTLPEITFKKINYTEQITSSTNYGSTYIDHTKPLSPIYKLCKFHMN